MLKLQIENSLSPSSFQILQMFFFCFFPEAFAYGNLLTVSENNGCIPGSPDIFRIHHIGFVTLEKTSGGELFFQLFQLSVEGIFSHYRMEMDLPKVSFQVQDFTPGNLIEGLPDMEGKPFAMKPEKFHGFAQDLKKSFSFHWFDQEAGST